MTVLSRDTLADQVSQHLFSLIADGTLAPGQALPSEGELISTFGVSRAVVREGLSHLKAMGVVEVANGKKATVKILDHAPLVRFFTVAATQQADDLVQLLEVRCGIESECAFLAAQRRSSEDIKLTSALLDEMAAVIGDVSGFDAGRYAALDRDFHLGVAKASKNFLLEQLALSIREPMMQSILLGLSAQDSKGQRSQIQADHRRIAEAISRGQSEEARAAVRSHIMSAARRMTRARSVGGPKDPRHRGGVSRGHR